MNNLNPLYYLTETTIEQYSRALKSTYKKLRKSGKDKMTARDILSSKIRRNMYKQRPNNRYNKLKRRNDLIRERHLTDVEKYQEEPLLPEYGWDGY